MTKEDDNVTSPTNYKFWVNVIAAMALMAGASGYQLNKIFSDSPSSKATKTEGLVTFQLKSLEKQITELKTSIDWQQTASDANSASLTQIEKEVLKLNALLQWVQEDVKRMDTSLGILQFKVDDARRK